MIGTLKRVNGKAFAIRTVSVVLLVSAATVRATPRQPTLPVHGRLRK